MIYIDVTHTLATGLRTGTQRVVRKLVEETARTGAPASVPVAAIDGRFHVLSAAGTDALLRPPPPAAGGDDDRGAQRRLGGLLQSVPAVFDRFQLWNFNRRHRARLRELTVPEPLMPGSDDTLVLVDAFWGGTATMRAAAHAARHGAAVVPMIHDMIPVTHPDVVHPATAITYARRLLRTFAFARGVLTNSAFTTSTVRTFLAARALDLPVAHFHLGHDIASREAPGRSGDAPFRYLMIGTIEPRKGHALVLDAFDALWQAGHDATLVFVGKMGWADPALKDRCARHPQLGRKFFLHHAASDEDLARELSLADATLLASSVEGFGLPLVESLARGVPVIASAIPVFREVGGDSALFFDSGDSQSLAAAVRRFEADPGSWRERAAAFSWPSWREATQTFAGVVLHLRRGHQPMM